MNFLNKNFSPHNPDRLMELVENRMEYVDVLLKMGFDNEKTNVRLFANDREKSEFDLIDLNNNYEPLLMTKFVIICLGKIVNQVILKNVYFCTTKIFKI